MYLFYWKFLHMYKFSETSDDFNLLDALSENNTHQGRGSAPVRIHKFLSINDPL